jgi:hypothetical protein
MEFGLPVVKKLSATDKLDRVAEANVAVGGGGGKVLTKRTSLHPELTVGASALIRNS